MLLATTEDLGGLRIERVLGLVEGNVVHSKHLGRDLMAGFKGLVGGEIRGYTEMLAEARQQARQRMVEVATQRGADAVVGGRYATSSIREGMSELLCYGTAVKLARGD